MWVKNKTSPGYTDESVHENVWPRELGECLQVFGVMTEEQEHISFLTGQNHTEASAETVVFRQVWF